MESVTPAWFEHGYFKPRTIRRTSMKHFTVHLPGAAAIAKSVAHFAISHNVKEMASVSFRVAHSVSFVFQFPLPKCTFVLWTRNFFGCWKETLEEKSTNFQICSCWLPMLQRALDNACVCFSAALFTHARRVCLDLYLHRRATQMKWAHCGTRVCSALAAIIHRSRDPTDRVEAH